MKTTNTQQKCTGASKKVANVESVIETLSVGVKSLEQIKIKKQTNLMLVEECQK